MKILRYFFVLFLLCDQFLLKKNKVKLLKGNCKKKDKQRKTGVMSSSSDSKAKLPEPKVYNLEEPKILEIPSQEFPGEVYKDNWNSLFFMDVPAPKDEFSYEYASNQPTSYVENSQIYYPQAYTGGFRVLI